MAPLNRFARTGQGEGRVFFFVNKKEAKKLWFLWARAASNAHVPN
jgi:hypothetical protein